MTSALIVIDVQESFRQLPLWAASSNPGIAGRVGRLVSAARGRGEQCCETTARLAADLGFSVTFVTAATTPIPHRDFPAGRRVGEILADPRTLQTADIITRTEYALAGRGDHDQGRLPAGAPCAPAGPGRAGPGLPHRRRARAPLRAALRGGAGRGRHRAGPPGPGARGLAGAGAPRPDRRPRLGRVHAGARHAAEPGGRGGAGRPPRPRRDGGQRVRGRRRAWSSTPAATAASRRPAPCSGTGRTSATPCTAPRT